MRKSTVNLSINSNVVEAMQISYPKQLSSITEDYWKGLLGKSLEDCGLKNNTDLINKLKEDLAKANVEQLKFEKDLERRKAEGLKEENQRIEEFMQSEDFLMKMREVQTLKDMSSKIAAERYELVILSLMQNTGKDRKEIEKMIASKKKSGDSVTLKKAKQ